MDHEYVVCVSLPTGEDFYVVTEPFLGTTVKWGEIDPFLNDEDLYDWDVYIPEPPEARHHDECAACAELSVSRCA